MDTSQQDDFATDYDAEWDREDASDQQAVVTDENPPTGNEETAPSDPAPDTTTDQTASDSSETPAEGVNDEGTRTETEDEKEALQRAETNLKLLAAEKKALEDRLAVRGRILKELEKKNAELEQAARPLTNFERDFPDYAEDFKKLAGREEAPAVEVDPEEALAAAANKIVSAHPDAVEVSQSQEMAYFLAANPMFAVDGKPMYVPTALHSDDPAEAIAALSYFKETRSAPPPEPPPVNNLESMVPPQTTQARPDIPKVNLSVQEEYDAEWAKDD